MIYSYSRLELYNHCPGAFKLKYILNNPEEENEPATVGKLAHAMIEADIKGEPVKMGTTNGFSEAFECYTIWRDKMKPELNPEDVLTTEKDFEVRIGKHTVKGIMDDVRDVGGFLTITDWKTTRKMKTSEEMKRGIQERLYCVAALKLFKGFDAVIFRTGNVRYGIYQVIEATKEEIDKWEEEIIGMIDLVSAHDAAFMKNPLEPGAFPYSPGAYCEWCGLFDFCEEMQKAKRVKAKPIKQSNSAVKTVQTIALLSRQLKDLKEELKLYCEHKGAVSTGGITWAFWPTVKKSIQTDMLPEKVLKNLEPFMVLDDCVKSSIWKSEEVMKELKKLNAILEQGGTEFKMRKTKEAEETIGD